MENKTISATSELVTSELATSELATSELATSESATSALATSALQDIYFAGGCFWGVEEYFSRITGVHEVTVGYANGSKANPTYEEVCSGNTGHAETVHVVYDPAIVSLKTLAQQFFKIVNPLTINRQGNDVGSQYRTGIYYVNAENKDTLRSVMEEVQKKYNKPLAVELMPLKAYYLAEEYHQDYLRKNPGGYCHINFDSLKDVQMEKQGLVDPSKYSKPSDAELLAAYNEQKKGTGDKEYRARHILVEKEEDAITEINRYVNNPEEVENEYYEKLK